VAGIRQRAEVPSRLDSKVSQLSTGDQSGYHHAQRPQVAARIGRLAKRLLRRHVTDGTEHGHRPCQTGLADELRQAEIQNLDERLAGDQHVRRLDVAVDDPALVGFLQRLRNLDCIIERLVQLQGPVLNPLFQGLARVVSHDQKHLAVGRLVDVVDGADVRVVERRSGLCLDDEAFLCGTIAGEIRRQDLDGHGTPQPLVFGAVDDTIPPPPSRSVMR